MKLYTIRDLVWFPELSVVASSHKAESTDGYVYEIKKEIDFGKSTEHSIIVTGRWQLYVDHEHLSEYAYLVSVYPSKTEAALAAQKRFEESVAQYLCDYEEPK